MNRFLLLICTSVLFTGALNAQNTLPRLFLDVPAFYLTSPDVENIDQRGGAGLHAAMNVGAHWGVVRAGGGSDFTFDFQADDVAESFQTSPFAFMEAGVGLYRSNGNKCARTRQNAFTAMGKGGFRYLFNEDAVFAPEGESPEQFDFTVGAEFGYFFIADIFRNLEVFADANYFTKAQTIQVNFGAKFFLNLRANR